MINHPKTTIWRNSPDGTILVETRNNLPSPIPRQGQLIYDPKFGETICSGITYSGSDNAVIEVRLTLR